MHARRFAAPLASLIVVAQLLLAGGALANGSRLTAGPANLAPPAISGSAVQGSLLSASTGSWSGSPTRYAYTWRDCDASGAACAKIAGATASTYRLAGSDVGHRLCVVVRAWNSSGSATVRSAATAVVTAPPAGDTTAPSAPTGLNASSPSTTQLALSWSPSSDNVGVVGYTAYLNGSKTSSSAGTSYTFSGLSCGTAYSLSVDAYDAAGNHSSRSSLSASTAACPAPPSDTATPSISGSAQVGGMLSASNGSWSGTTPMTYAYQWQDCDSAGAGCLAVAGASGGSYTLAGGDQGHTVRVLVTASNSAGASSASSAQTAVVQASPGPVAPGLHVAGNQLLDANGTLVRLHGVNYSGPEYACIQGWGIFDGPSDDASVAAMASWRVNIVRIPLNEDCWLGINGVPAAYDGANYRTAIAAYVNLLHQHGMYAELSLIWAAPGTYQATYQSGAPDADHSPAFWSSLATTFAGDSKVILAPWGETIVNANCFLNGGVCEATYGPSNTPYNTAGMQQAVNLMRQAGYNGVISIPGIDYANDMTQWLSHKPVDPLGQLIAEAHVYGKNTCDTTACFDTNYAPVAASVPLLFGETGNSYDDSVCGSGYVSTFMNWADAHNTGYEAWTWDTWGTCGSLITDFNGTPNGTYGTYVKNHYATLP